MLETLKTSIFSELVYCDNPAGFNPQGDLLESGLDDMGIMRLILFTEEEFRITLSEDELEPDNLQTLNNWNDGQNAIRK